MATVKTQCPKCVGTGLTGIVVEARCSQCQGTGTISLDDSQTFAALNTTVVGGSGNSALVVTMAAAVPKVAIRALARGDK